jgi:hypothetical protein
MITTLGLSACQPPPTPQKIEPAELIDQGDGRNLVILTEKAAERLDIQTDTVHEEQILMTRTYGGEVTETSADSGAIVMVSLTTEEAGMVASNVPALVYPLNGDDPEDSDTGTGFMAEVNNQDGLGNAEDNGQAILYYSIDDAETGLVTGQRLAVEVSLKGEEGLRLVIPVSSLIYDINGGTWVYISPEPLQFLRVPVVVDYIKGNLVVLKEGPPIDAKVVTVGVAELYGTDTGVGK